MLRFTEGMLPLFLMSACGQQSDPVTYLPGQSSSNGVGGARPFMTLPFPSGEYWNLTQGYDTGSHQDYGFKYGNDTYALDFSQSGCDPYGKPINPILDGEVIKVEVADTDSDSGYGNSVLIAHEEGYVSRYGHMTGHNVSLGDRVDTNTVLGWVGNTGYVIGNGCASHPGTHLHLALYQNLEAVPTLPLSGTLMAVGCWYNREGKESCNGNPGPYDPVESSNSGNSGTLNVDFLDISPEEGSANNTKYIWVSTVVSEHGKPDVTLKITNPNDGVTYDFSMSTESTHSPWVFTYQKALNDAATYTYWVEATVDGRSDHSSEQRVSVSNDWSEDLDINFEDVSPSEGEAQDTEFQWSAWVETDRLPSVRLKIVNPGDSTIYSFEMSTQHEGAMWYANYEKTLNDGDSVYTWWIEAETSGGTQNSSVGHVETR